MSDRTPLPPTDRDAAALMWRACAATLPAAAAAEEPSVEHFGDSAELADELLGLVLAGAKRATAALVADFAAQDDPLPRIRSHWIACDGRGVPRAVLRSVELRIGPFRSVDAAFAHDEAEGDRSLASWVEGHRGYWQRVCAARGEEFSEDADVVFERFRVVWPPEHAD